MEQQHGNRVGQPVLLAPLVDAADPIQAGLYGPQDRRQECSLAVEDARHVAAKRLHERDDDDAIQNDLQPANSGHGIKPSSDARSQKRSEPLGPQQRVNQINQQAD